MSTMSKTIWVENRFEPSCERKHTQVQEYYLCWWILNSWVWMTGSRWWQVLLRLKEGQTQSQVGGLDNCRPRSKTLLICLCIRQTFQCAGVLIPWCTYQYLFYSGYLSVQDLLMCLVYTVTVQGDRLWHLMYTVLLDSGHLGSSGLCVGRHLRAFPIFNCFHNYCTLLHDDRATSWCTDSGPS